MGAKGLMTDYKKYIEILKALDDGLTQAEIVCSLGCSYGTITRAKTWKSAGSIIKRTTIKNSSSKNSSSKSSSSKNSSSKNSSSIALGTIQNFNLNIGYNSRCLSWLGAVFDISEYYNMDKSSLKSKLIEKINSL